MRTLCKTFAVILVMLFPAGSHAMLHDNKANDYFFYCETVKGNPPPRFSERFIHIMTRERDSSFGKEYVDLFERTYITQRFEDGFEITQSYSLWIEYGNSVETEGNFIEWNVAEEKNEKEWDGVQNTAIGSWVGFDSIMSRTDLSIKSKKFRTVWQCQMVGMMQFEERWDFFMHRSANQPDEKKKRLF